MNDSSLTRGTPCPQQAGAESLPSVVGAEVPTATVSPSIDFQLLDQWSDELGKDTVRSLIAIYLKNSAELLDVLAAAAAAKDMTRLARTAHGLKGSSSNLGITAIFEPARTLEAAARDGDAGRALAIATRLSATFDDVAIALREYGR